MTETEAANGTTDTPAEGNEASDSAENLDAILNEWDGGEQQEPQKPEPPKADNRVAELEARLNAIEQEKAKQNTEDGIMEAVKIVKGEDLDIDDDLVSGFLYVKAERDQRLRSAFFNRHTDPDKWNKTLGAVRKEIVAKLTKPDPVNEDRGAAIAAVRNQSNQAPEPDNPHSAERLAKMSDHEFDAEVAKLRG